MTATAMLARPAHADGGVYATPSYWLGAGTAPSAAVSPPSTLRNAIGVTGDRAAPFCGRGGLTLDLASARARRRTTARSSALRRRSTGRSRTAGTSGRGSRRRSRSDGIAIAMLGGRVAHATCCRSGSTSRTRAQSGPDAHTGVTVLGGVGLEGKAGAIATGVEAGVFLVLLAALLAALSHEGT